MQIFVSALSYIAAVTTLICIYLQEEEFPGNHDGVWKGIHLFESRKGRGLFLPLMKLKPDQRFGDTVKKEQQHNCKLSL